MDRRPRWKHLTASGYGDVRAPSSFIRWLRDYADLAPLEITAEELWELRNGLLHMSNLNSSQVRSSSVRRISFRVGGAGVKLPDTGIHRAPPSPSSESASVSDSPVDIASALRPCSSADAHADQVSPPVQSPQLPGVSQQRGAY